MTAILRTSRPTAKLEPWLSSALAAAAYDAPKRATLIYLKAYGRSDVVSPEAATAFLEWCATIEKWEAGMVAVSKE